ncbi:hypothetical protein TWF506_004080 [Arthrobotrys conoides]|uniref:Uncharacterized protein n=1 Tax=Arthrobotrys conoides TaxID=74498 RepID=A0AAN8NAW1_9PEZI
MKTPSRRNTTKIDGYEYQDDLFLSARICRRTVEIKYYELWVAINPVPERSWSPPFDERYHKPRLSTSFPFLEDPVFSPPLVSPIETERQGEAGDVLERQATPTNKELDIVVPAGPSVIYRIRFSDCTCDLNPAERELRISPTTTVKELVSKTWGAS